MSRKSNTLAITEENSTKDLQQEIKKEYTESLIYVGSSLGQGTLQQYSIFNNGLPAYLDSHIEKCPAIKELIVPVSKVNEYRLAIQEQGSRENALNQQILNYARGEK